MNPVLYDQATCLAVEPMEGTRQLCPGDGAMLAFQVLMLALLVVVAVHVVEGSVAQFLENRRLERLRRVTGRTGDGNEEEGPPDDLWRVG